MGKTNKQKKQERRERIQTANVIKYMKCLGPDDMVEWNEKLEAIEKAETDEEKEKLTQGLQLWLAMKYVLTNRSICEDCARQPTCYRKQEKVKQCKLFEGKESEDNETI